MITAVEIVANNPNKATVINETGVVYVDNLFWRTTSADGRLFTLLHEQGHLVNGSESEYEADTYAKQTMLAMGYSVGRITKAAKEVLGGNPKTDFRLKRLSGTAMNINPLAIPAIGDVLGDIIGLIGKGKREKEAYEQALRRQQENNETAEDMAILNARARQDRLKEVLKVVGLIAVLIAGVAMVFLIIKSDKPQPKFIFPELPKGYKLPTPNLKQLT